jgi:hypothetical protein
MNINYNRLIKNNMLKFMMFIVVIFIFTGICYGAGDLCLSKYGDDLKKYSEWYFGVDYPYWYSIGLIKTESRCVWRRSLDGLGSVGVGQITPRFWNEELRKRGLEFYAVEGHEHHAGAICYILSEVYRNVSKECCVCGYCHKEEKGLANIKKLWVVYQGYNRNISKLNKEIDKAKSCSWSDWKKECKEVDVCVWRNKDGSCRQWRNGCDINAEYSEKVYNNGIFYRREVGIDNDGKYMFW